MIPVSVASWWARSITLALIFSVLSACAYLPETTSIVPDDWQATIEHRKQISSWNLRGRLGIQTEDNGGSLDLIWKQQGESYTIRLIAPMGQGTILIRGNEDGVYIKTSEGEEYAENSDALLASTLGIDLPVSALRDWLRGIPMQNRPSRVQRWDTMGQLSKLVQADWNIEISRYQQVEDYTLPHAFYLGRDDRPELGIRLLISQWRIGQS